jgi:flagellin-like protein
MKKFRRSKKALSPVVASIILIAVTVAVSIAVAAWMGALTVGFMGSSSITITNMQFTDDGGSPAANIIVCSLKNTGTKSVTIAGVRINNNVVDTDDFSAATSLTLAAGDLDTLTIEGTYANWQEGNPYKIDLYDGSGQVVGSYQATAPA